MRKLSVLAIAACFLLTACAGIGINLQPEATDVAMEVVAFTFGYKGVEKYPSDFQEAGVIAREGLELLEADELTLNELVENLREKVVQEVTEDPLLQYQVKKLLSLVEVDIDAENPIDIPGDKDELVKKMLAAFAEGVEAQTVVQ